MVKQWVTEAGFDPSNSVSSTPLGIFYFVLMVIRLIVARIFFNNLAFLFPANSVEMVLIQVLSQITYLLLDARYVTLTRLARLLLRWAFRGRSRLPLPLSAGTAAACSLSFHVVHELAGQLAGFAKYGGTRCTPCKGTLSGTNVLSGPSAYGGADAREDKGAGSPSATAPPMPPLTLPTAAPATPPAAAPIAAQWSGSTGPTAERNKAAYPGWWPPEPLTCVGACTAEVSCRMEAPCADLPDAPTGEGSSATMRGGMRSVVSVGGAAGSDGKVDGERGA